MNKRRLSLLVAALLGAALLLSGCAAGTSPAADAAAAGGGVPGFLIGLWHGFILPFSFVFSLLVDNVHVYEVRNGGHLYDLGFVIGAFVIFSGGTSSGLTLTRSRRA